MCYICNDKLEINKVMDVRSKVRLSFASKFGVVAAAAGSAVGLGNIWTFPYDAGRNGGGSFFAW